MEIGTLTYEKPVIDTTEAKIQRDGFVSKLEHLINRYSMENESDTPDFILATYLMNCLDAFNLASNTRSLWYAPPLPIYEETK